MNPAFLQLFSKRSINHVLAVFVLFLAFSPASHAQKSPPPGQKTFDTPNAAANAVIEAVKKNDVNELMAIFGPKGKPIVSSGDPTRDKTSGARFLELVQRGKRVDVSPFDYGEAILTVGTGDDEWPFPVPIRMSKGKWHFDSEEGSLEILARRIGENELDAISACLGFSESQEEYASVQHDKSGSLQYAQRIISTPGKQDGLYWKNADGTAGGPIGETIAKAISEGYTSKSEPYHGYHYRVLKAQGPAAPGGARSFVVGGAMIGGYALIAWPAEYGNSGIQTFIIGNDQILYEKDLGPNTARLVEAIKTYNPDSTWTEVIDVDQ
jgi:hypothetical protein